MADLTKIKEYISIFRNSILFLGGLYIAIHETIQTAGERPSYLILAATMMGLPLALKADKNGKE